MCGIAGLIRPNKVTDQDLADVEQMVENIHARGPDASNVYKFPQVILGNTRLAITDPHNHEADLPLTNGRVTVAYNGQIYNHTTLRQELSDYDFQTNSDTEIILAAYEKWGEDCFSRFEGMFAICIYDHNSGQTILARDPTGQKPLYIHESDDGIAFSSDINSLVHNKNLEKTFDRDSIIEYLAVSFISGPNTHIQEIKKVLPGHYLKIGKNAKPENNRFLDLSFDDAFRGQDKQAVTEHLKDVIDQSCQETFNLEVPYALLLSGGLDSTVVMMKAHAAGLNLKTYSIGFERDAPPAGHDFEANAAKGSASNGVNGINGSTAPADKDDVRASKPIVLSEFQYSDRLAEDYGTSHKKIIMTRNDYMERLRQWIDTTGEPHITPEAPALLMLYDEIQKDGIKVVFTGSGVDELFDGYMNTSRMEGVPFDDFPKEYSTLFTDHQSMKALLGDASYVDVLMQRQAARIDMDRDAVRSTDQLTTLADIYGCLAELEHRQMDLASMSNSVEARAPLSSVRLLHTAFSFDPSLRGFEKQIIKDAVSDIVPDWIINREKAWFPVPNYWATESAREELARYMTPGSPLHNMGLANMTEQDLERIDDSLLLRMHVLGHLLDNQAKFVHTPVVTNAPAREQDNEPVQQDTKPDASFG